jgi:isocitrate dehydrogenase (NAD+)
MTRTVTLIPGDGITGDLVEPVLALLEKAGADVRFERREAGCDCFEKGGSALPEETLESIRRNGVALKGKLLARPRARYPSPN